MTIKKPRKKSATFTVIPNPELVAALKIYRPQFGNDQDKSLLNRLDQLQHDLSKVDNEILRGVKKKFQEPKPLNKKMKDLLQREGWLIREVTSRNMDF